MTKRLKSIPRPRRKTIGILAVLSTVMLMSAAGMLVGRAFQDPDIRVYKSASCGCCNKWVEHLRQAGFVVQAEDRRDLQPVKSQLGVPSHLQSCHTAEIGGYVVEGHVPADLIERMLRERPRIRGLVVPGMPMGSPGMEGPRKDAYRVLTLNHDGTVGVYARR